MSESSPKNVGEQAAYGYRQLHAMGPSGGSELRYMVYAGVGVALGIVMGTLLAGYSQHSVESPSNHAKVQTSTAVPLKSSSPALKAMDGQAAPSQTAPTQVAQAIAKQPEPVKQAALNASPALQPVVTNSIAKRVSIVHRHRPGHMSLARRRHRQRERVHSRRWRHGHTTAVQVAKAATTVEPPQSVAPTDPFVFMIEGNLTEANYDRSKGLIETYEGESFTVSRGANADGSAELNDFPLSVHYLCNDLGSCSLVLPNGAVLQARQMKSIN